MKKPLWISLINIMALYGPVELTRVILDWEEAPRLCLNNGPKIALKIFRERYRRVRERDYR